MTICSYSIHCQLNFLFNPINGVACTSDGADKIRNTIGVESFAQSPDMHIDGAFLHIDITPPNEIEKLGAGVRQLRLAAKRLLNGELLVVVHAWRVAARVFKAEGYTEAKNQERVEI